jgi:hypothetical protein
MHDRITVATTEEYLSETTAKICIKCTIYHRSGKMDKWHVRIDTLTKIISRALRTSRIAVRGYLDLIFIDHRKIKQVQPLFAIGY